MEQELKKMRPGLQKTRILLLTLFIVAIAGEFSCKPKPNPTPTIIDSVAITKITIATKAEKIYYLILTKNLQTRIFMNSEVKMIDFKWHSYPANTWGLDAYGMDSSGRMLSGPFLLDPITAIPPLTNYWYLDRVEPQVMLRGDIKFILGLPTLGQDVPIPDSEYKDLLFSPTPYPYPETNDMYFEVTVFPNIPLQKGKKVASQQGFTNPSPPARPYCNTDCDDESY